MFSGIDTKARNERGNEWISINNADPYMGCTVTCDLEGRVTANLYKVILSDLIYRMIKCVCVRSVSRVIFMS